MISQAIQSFIEERKKLFGVSQVAHNDKLEQLRQLGMVHKVHLSPLSAVTKK
jgi:hypothetical protein